MLLTLDNISCFYKAQCLFQNLNLQVARGERLQIIGRNGIGKSTLISIILGEVAPASGSMTIKPNIKISYVPQDTSLNLEFPISLQEVVSMGRSRGTSIPLNDILQLFNLYDLRNKSFAQLSGGQRQKALIARAIMADADLLLLDEPISSLDIDSKISVLNILKSHCPAVIIVSHDLIVEEIFSTTVFNLENFQC